MKNVKIIASVLSLAFLLTSCGGEGSNSSEENNNKSVQAQSEKSSSDKDEKVDTKDYTFQVITREDGSGTRGAFSEIIGLIEEKDGNKKDLTTKEASVQNSTNAVMQQVSLQEGAIGYISLGSLNDTVKAVKIEGVEANKENVKDGSYKLQRPFNIAYKKNEDLPEEAKDFLNYILSSDISNIVDDNGYISSSDKKEYQKKDGLSGKVTIAGSTSVSPLMEKLIEEYKKVQPDVSVELQSIGSTEGLNAVNDGQAQIAMVSRELSDDENKDFTSDVLAKDGIAVIVNKKSSLEDLNTDTILKIYKGEIKSTSEIK
ncbi:MAG: substrate-binding domain-containing protein [Peptoniphilaceae bacterium]|nr:substrate-binding domain-containing protein [Peptoniphilaceae bacterium]